MRKLLLIIIPILLIGCKGKTVLVPVKEMQIEYRGRLKVDSIYNSDTTLIYIKGDTVYNESVKWRNKFVMDTVSVIKIDSIPYPVEVVKYVNQLNKWQKIRLQLLNVIIGVILILGAFKIGRL